MKIPRGKFIGERVGGLPAHEAEHFIKCPACGGWIDMRDLGSVFDHEGRPILARTQAQRGGVSDLCP